MTPEQLAKLTRRNNLRIVRDPAALQSYVDDGWPLWRVAERHARQPHEVRRAMERCGIEVPDEAQPLRQDRAE